MKIITDINDNCFGIEINVHPNSEGQFDATIEGEPVSMQIIDKKPNSVTLSIDGRVRFYEFEKEDGRIKSTIHNNRSYRTRLRNRQQEQLEVLLEEFGAGMGGSATETNVVAPMPGKILGLNVKQGEKVKLGQVVLVLEAMKMENEISSTVEGTVREIRIKVGDTVNAGDLLIEIDPPE